MAGIVPGLELMTPVASHVTHRALEWLRSDKRYSIQYVARSGQLACAPPDSFDQFIVQSEDIGKPEGTDTYFHVADARGLLEETPLIKVWLTHDDYMMRRKTQRVCRFTVACKPCSVHLDAALQVAISMNERYQLYLEEKFQQRLAKYSTQHVNKE
jgi:hypothetical protein